VTVHEASRRNLFTGLAAVGVAVPLLAACGDDGDTDTTGSVDTPSDSPTATASGGTTPAPDGAIPTADIPVGGGKIFKDDQLVVTQPVAGEFKAFSAVCTHQGCTASSVEDSVINCACHNSKFSIDDGSVEQGPATKALSEKSVTVSGDSLTVS
jgi:Rieske Fe-S protein